MVTQVCIELVVHYSRRIRASNESLLYFSHFHWIMLNKTTPHQNKSALSLFWNLNRYELFWCLNLLSYKLTIPHCIGYFLLTIHLDVWCDGVYGSQNLTLKLNRRSFPLTNQLTPYTSMYQWRNRSSQWWWRHICVFSRLFIVYGYPFIRFAWHRFPSTWWSFCIWRSSETKRPPTLLWSSTIN